ncbi:TauD/TfdA family dioxygenase [Ekhidna sp.]|uniref:TauD/TfdA family dioxygenase n=2 Tax=Ekhidna sp. TaxID=2608089 RepID=UPI00329730AA
MKTFDFNDYFSLTNDGYYSSEEDYLEVLNEVLNEELGYLLLKGFPIHRQTEKEIQENILKFGFTLGVPVSETKYNDFILRLEDLNTIIDDGKANSKNRPLLNGQEDARAVPIHNDRSDLLVLCGMKPARKGGETFVVSSNQICEKLIDKYPKQFEVLQQPFKYDYMEGLQEIPIISKTSNGYIMWYVRSIIENTIKTNNLPNLTIAQIDALDTLDQVINEFRESIILKHGDVLIVNNHKALHGRLKFLEGDNRLLYRIWISSPASQKLPNSYSTLFRHTDQGCYRGGVWSDDFELNQISTNINLAKEQIKKLVISD